MFSLFIMFFPDCSSSCVSYCSSAANFIQTHILEMRLHVLAAVVEGPRLQVWIAAGRLRSGEVDSQILSIGIKVRVVGVEVPGTSLQNEATLVRKKRKTAEQLLYIKASREAKLGNYFTFF